MSGEIDNLNALVITISDELHGHDFSLVSLTQFDELSQNVYTTLSGQSSTLADLSTTLVDLSQNVDALITQVDLHDICLNTLSATVNDICGTNFILLFTSDAADNFKFLSFAYGLSVELDNLNALVITISDQLH